MIGSALDNLADPANGTFYPVQLPSLTNRYNVNVPIALMQQVDSLSRFSVMITSLILS